MSNQVRLGVVGTGNMGLGHIRYIANGEIKGLTLTAVCDKSPANVERAKRIIGSDVKVFDEPEAMFRSGDVDGVLIATPHPFHPALAIAAFSHSLHVLTEKPAGLHIAEVRKMNEAAAASGKVFGIVFHQRFYGAYSKLRELIADGELGTIRRTNWIITEWYRKQSYYNVSPWRGTWAGEGGGSLMTQASHQLDLWQWTTGMMPARIWAKCYFGKRRDIETDDEVIAFAEYENGATGVFVVSVTEAPGTNRYEVVGDRGKAVVEDGRLTFWRLRVPESRFNAEDRPGFPEAWKIEIPVEPSPHHTVLISDAHKRLMQNWTDAILHGAPLVARGEEGLLSLTLSNAMYLSTWTGNWVDVPFDEDLFAAMLQERINKSDSARV
ncbi:MAG: Gfo/Idh/MocA family oxidoreductase [Firmicutes bacterium]|nr:Gfo/Idh/MocA family oxidoreductase [Bacillota bacterium]